MIGVGIGIPFFRSFGGGIDAQAQVHFNRVIADGGVVPSGLTGVNAFFSAVKAIYGTSDINSAISAAYDPHYLGYRLGAGSGTTLGQAARTLYAPKGIFGGIGTGSAFYEGTGVSSNFISTPNAAANQITGDIEIVVNASFDNLGTTYFLCSKIAGPSNYAYEFTRDSSNRLLFSFSTTGSNQINVQSTVIQPFAIGVSGWLKVVRNSTTGDVTFSTSTNGITYTQLGAIVNSTTGSMFAGTRPLGIAASSAGSGALLGRLFRLTIANSIGGTPVVNFNANQYTGANTWTSTTGEVWTVNSTGAGLADVTQTTAASQPLLLAHTGENYWWGSGVAGNFVSTPNAAANQITGDIEIIGKRVKIKDYTGTYAIASKGDQASNRGWVLRSSAGTLVFLFSQSGTGMISTVASVSLTAAGYTADTEYYFKVTRISSSGVVQFYGSIDGVNYTQIGSNVTASSGALFNSTGQVCVGTWNNDSNHFLGSIGGVTISNSIGGAPVVDFNPSSYNPATSQTEWTSATGEVWSINVGTAATGYKAALVTKSIVQADGIDDTLLSGVLTNVQYHSLHLALNPFNIPLSGGVYYMDGGSASGLIYGISDSLSSFNGTELAFIGDLEYRIQYCHVDFNNTTSNVYLNNSNNVLGATGTRTSTRNNLFSSGSGSSFANAIISTAIRASVIDNSTQRTALYDYVRQINNNAF